jgi:voltage-gated sodium channel type II alpha
MTEDSDSISEEERSLFRPFTRESLQVIEQRIAEELEKQKEFERKRAEGEVSRMPVTPVASLLSVVSPSSSYVVYFLLSFRI